MISGLQNTDSDLEQPLRLLAEADAERAAVLEKREEIEQQIAVKPVRLDNSRAIDQEYDRQQHLQKQLRMLERGELLRGPGTTYPSLVNIDERIAELTEKIERLRARHDMFAEQARSVLAVQPAPSQEVTS